MAKQVITISIDHELVNALREQGNISPTINSLLSRHLFGSNTKDGVKKEIKEKEELLEKTKKDISELKAKLIKLNKPVVRYT